MHLWSRSKHGGWMSSPLKIVILCLVLVCTLAIPSFADGIQTITAGGITFSANLTTDLTTHTYQLTFSGVNTSSSSGATLNTFALQLFGPGADGDFTISTSPSVNNWLFYAGQKINNSGGLGCPTDSNGTAGWL